MLDQYDIISPMNETDSIKFILGYALLWYYSLQD